MSAAPLSTLLREATWELHREVEALPLVQSILQGTISRMTFIRYTGCLATIYEALETGLRQHSATAGLLIPGLARAAHLQADLAAWESAALDSPLAARIREISTAFPPGLVAYFYLRYFGDLSGGQMLRQSLDHLLPSASSPGLSFYSFAELGSVGPVKQRLREMLDALPFSDAERSGIVEEARRGFLEHGKLFRLLEMNA